MVNLCSNACINKKFNTLSNNDEKDYLQKILINTAFRYYGNGENMSYREFMYLNTDKQMA